MNTQSDTRTRSLLRQLVRYGLVYLFFPALFLTPALLLCYHGVWLLLPPLMQEYGQVVIVTVLVTLTCFLPLLAACSGFWIGLRFLRRFYTRAQLREVLVGPRPNSLSEQMADRLLERLDAN